MGKISRLYKVSTVAVLKWIRAAAVEVEPLNSVAESDIVMIDEVSHFVNGKKQNIWRATRRVNLLDGNWAIVMMPVPKRLSHALTQEHSRSQQMNGRIL